MPNKLSDLEIDEVSLVYKGANPHAKVTIAKSVDGEQEDEVEIFDNEGNPIDVDALEFGDVVFDEDGNPFQFVEEEVEELEPEPVGKAFSAPRTREVSKSGGYTLADQVKVELSKALSDEDRDNVISKALGRMEELEEIAKSAAILADEEREARVLGEYREIAKSYNLPVEDDELARVMKNVNENLPQEDAEIIAKCFAMASDALFAEEGAIGGGDNSDIMNHVNAFAQDQVAKSGDLSAVDATIEAFSANPELYDRYLQES